MCFVVRSSRKIDRGRAAAAPRPAARHQPAKPVDGERQPVRAQQLTEVRVRGGIEDIDATVAEVADEEIAGKLPERQ
jgi:hypothetical protein